MIVIGTNRKTGEEIEFKTLTEAANHFHISPQLMSYRIHNAVIDKDGWRLTSRSLKEEELNKRQRYYRRTKGKIDINSIKECDKNKLLAYEKNKFGACITPCPFRDSPKPKIGSSLCQFCSYFKGINKETLHIACGRTTSAEPII